LCMKWSSFMLTLLIPSPKSSGKDIDVYFRSLIDDLKDLWAKTGVETIDVATSQEFNMRSMVLWTINNFLLEVVCLGGVGKGKHPMFRGVEIKHNVLVKLNWTKRSIFYKLEYWSFHTLKHNLHVMHIEKNVLESILNTLLMNDKSKDTGKARQDLKSLEAIFDGPIYPRWMYPFKRYMKKLKNYVRNKAKPKGSITEGYVAKEALTFSFYYFQDVTIKFNRLDHNVDCPPPTCQFQVFKLLGKSIGLRSVIRFDHQELKKVLCDLFALACGPSHTSISVNSCVVNDVRFLMHSRDEHHTTQNCDICLPDSNEEMYYGQLEQILKFSYLSFKTVLFRVKWFDTSNKGRIQNFVIRNNIIQIKANGKSFKNDQYVLATQVKQCFYLEDMARRLLGWKVVEHVSHKKFSNVGVIMVEDDLDVIHVDNSFDLALSTSLNDLEIVALIIDGQSIDVDAPPDIIDVVDEDDDIIDEKVPIPHDLVDSDDEDLVNLDIDDGVNVVYSSEEEY
nr:hypothetical protein [Tanacetum cinerariifolium]